MADTSGLVCGKCGKRIRTVDKFCTKCGLPTGFQPPDMRWLTWGGFLVASLSLLTLGNLSPIGGLVLMAVIVVAFVLTVTNSGHYIQRERWKFVGAALFLCWGIFGGLTRVAEQDKQILVPIMESPPPGEPLVIEVYRDENGVNRERPIYRQYVDEPVAPLMGPRTLQLSGSSRRGWDNAPKNVSVSGYTRKDGTHVRAHSRRSPRM